jgi:hypothetical protein
MANIDTVGLLKYSSDDVTHNFAHKLSAGFWSFANDVLKFLT